MDITLEKIVPLKKSVLIKPRTRTAETDGGLVIPEESYTPTPVVGDVLAVGEESQFKVGDIVFFRRYSIDELKFNTADGVQQIVSLITDDEIVAKISNG